MILLICRRTCNHQGTTPRKKISQAALDCCSQWAEHEQEEHTCSYYTVLFTTTAEVVCTVRTHTDCVVQFMGQYSFLPWLYVQYSSHFLSPPQGPAGL